MQQDRELLNAYKEAQRAENLIKYKADIMSRPKAEWHSNRREKLEIKRESYNDLKNIKEKFDNHGKKVQEKGKSKNEKKRDKKAKAKENHKSKFNTDAETDYKAQEKAKMSTKREQFQQKDRPLMKDGKIQVNKQDKGNYTGKKFAPQVTHKSFKGKRNTVGAKLAGFKGERSLVQLKKNEENKRIRSET